VSGSAADRRSGAPGDLELREALSTRLSSLPERFQSDRAELLELLLGHGILHRAPSQPVLSRDGTSARWMLDSLPVTLTARGAELAGRCVLELLKDFDGTQIATYGVTGIPILESCIVQSGGRYRGLIVRKERKQHGSLKLVEGRIDPHEPTVLIDDSISSGMSMEMGCKTLEESGLRVEGGIALVRFGWYGGYASMQERGYHVAAVYDVWEDVMSRMEGEQVPLQNPSKWFPDFAWSSSAAPEGLHPARLARAVLLEYLQSGLVLRPPEHLDRHYGAEGGVWVSIRSRENTYRRYARDGFWHFPGEDRWSAAEGIARACVRTAHELPRGDEGIRLIDGSNIAVTFFSGLEECAVGQLDNDKYGIVVCSRERRARMGGALPRMPGISSEWEQFEHARRKNGELVSFEPFVIYRHQVVKAVEPDVAWQPTGVPREDDTPWHEDPSICGLVAERARDVVVAATCATAETTAPLRDDLLPKDLDSIYVTVYIRGHLRGCMGTVVQDLDADIRKLALAALQDGRFGAALAGGGPNDVAVTVSLLFGPLELGAYSPEEVALRVRHGRHALMVYQNNRVGLLLPFVAVTNNLDRSEFVAEVIDKAGITRPPYYWCRFECTSWLADGQGICLMEGGFPRRSERAPLAASVNELAMIHVKYLLRQLEDDGSLYFFYEPFQDRLHQGITAPRRAHGAWVLARACSMFGGPELEEARNRIIEWHLNSVRQAEDGCWLESGAEPASVSELSFLLLALCETGDRESGRGLAASLAATLWSTLDAHGRIRTHRAPGDADDAYQDYFPGQVLLALAVARRAGIADLHERALDRAFRYYRHRFRYRRNFGQVSWLMQAFGAWWEATRQSQFADLVFEVGDWIVQYQQETTGAFINDHQTDTPGYTTALYLEGIAVGARVAAALSDERRQRRYLESLNRGFAFVERLTIQPRDAAILPNAEFAIGGLRQSVYASEIRVDFVQHSLSAIIEAYSSAESCRAEPSTVDLIPSTSRPAHRQTP
jgi:AMMECR1 domain-containing protein/orotate phosphoribosyltransferase